MLHPSYYGCHVSVGIKDTDSYFIQRLNAIPSVKVIVNITDDDSETTTVV